MNNKQKVVCIIQARMASSRLPGKVLKDICGHPMLYWVLNRAGKSEKVDELVIATTLDRSDDPIVEWCQQKNIHCFRGDAFDVLDRYYQAAKKFQADVVIRLTADCPLIDPQLLDDVLDAFFEKKADFGANRLPPPFSRTYPIGLDIEVASFKALSEAWQKAKLPYEREHVMPYLYAVKDRFNILVLEADQDHGNRRWTVDTPEDLEFIRAVYQEPGFQHKFSWFDVLRFLDEHPALEKINADISHKTFYDVDTRSKKKIGK
jgi:spore coat polysaccharide biosynthesis protein SpsF